MAKNVRLKSNESPYTQNASDCICQLHEHPILKIRQWGPCITNYNLLISLSCVKLTLIFFHSNFFSVYFRGNFEIWANLFRLSLEVNFL